MNLQPATCNLQPETPAYRAAAALAYVVSPLSLPPLLFGLAAGHVGARAAEVAWTVGVGLACFGLAPLGFLVYLVRRSRAATIELRERKRRTPGFLFGVGSYAVGLVLVLLFRGTAAPLVGALMALQIVNSLVLMIVTWRWKISIHAFATAGFVAVLGFLAFALPGSDPLIRPTAALLLLPLVPLMMWARVRTGAHTPGQVAAGTLFGLTAPLVELAALLRFGLVM